MLKDLFNIWRDRSMFNAMYDEFTQMINNAEWMFREVCELLLGGEAGHETQKTLFKTDISINKAERRIRKRLLEHLNTHPQADIGACLVLMSVVKDAERIGDYCKNLFNVWRMYGGPLKPGRFAELIEEMRRRLLGTFGKVINAFTKVDEELGEELVENEVRYGKRLDDAIAVLANSDLPAKDAVCLTLTLRHMKRVSGHLGNIASAVVMPVHKIDYFDRDWQESGKKEDAQSADESDDEA